MSRNKRKYDHEYKIQAVKIAREIGGAKAAKELGIPEGTIETCPDNILFWSATSILPIMLFISCIVYHPLLLY